MISVENSVLLIVDVQGRLAEIVHESERILTNIETLIKGAQILGMPIIWMEQYPEGLGPTVMMLRHYLNDEYYISKRTFSAYKTKHFQEKITKLNRSSFLVTGIESHVCVYQTVKDLLKERYSVEIVADAISSRTKANRIIGLEKMTSLGASMTSTEMALFELMETSTHPEFKEMMKLIK